MNPNLPISDPHDGWILKQMKAKKPESSIEVLQSDSGVARFASRRCRIAGQIAGLEVRRLYRRRDDGVSFVFFYAIKGDYTSVTVEQINILSDFLKATFQNDFETIFLDFEPSMVRTLQTKFNTEKSTLYLYFEMKFGKTWTPGEDFKEA